MPKGTPSCGNEPNRPRLELGCVFHCHEDRAAPFAARGDALQNAQEQQQDRGNQAGGLA